MSLSHADVERYVQEGNLDILMPGLLNDTLEWIWVVQLFAVEGNIPAIKAILELNLPLTTADDPYEMILWGLLSVIIPRC